MFRKIKRKHKYGEQHDQGAFGNTGHDQSLDGNI